MIDIHTLHSALSFVLPAAPKLDVRYYLNGVLLDVTEEETTLVATDGHRLHKVLLAGKASFDLPEGQWILDHEALTRVLRAIKPRVKDQYDVKVMEDGLGNITFLAPDVDSTIRCIDGKYPDWRRVFPNRNSMLDETGPDGTGFNITYIEQAAKAAKALGNKSMVSRLFKFSDERAPMLIEIPACPSLDLERAEIIIMPMTL